MQAPVLQAPILQAPILQAPILQAPILQAPVLQAPILQAPILQAPVAGPSSSPSTPTVRRRAVLRPAPEIRPCPLMPDVVPQPDVAPQTPPPPPPPPQNEKERKPKRKGKGKKAKETTAEEEPTKPGFNENTRKRYAENERRYSFYYHRVATAEQQRDFYKEYKYVPGKYIFSDSDSDIFGTKGKKGKITEYRDTDSFTDESGPISEEGSISEEK